MQLSPMKPQPDSQRATPLSRQGTLWPTFDPHLKFVVKLHHATRLHYDFRLQLGQVLISWVWHQPPSIDPAVRRKTTRVGDHALRYALSERVIPPGQYGAGPTLVWDYGVYRPAGQVLADQHEAQLVNDLSSGLLKIELFGKKLKGVWVLERHDEERTFQRDEHDTTSIAPQWSDRSVISGDSLDDLRRRFSR